MSGKSFLPSGLISPCAKVSLMFSNSSISYTLFNVIFLPNQKASLMPGVAILPKTILPLNYLALEFSRLVSVRVVYAYNPSSRETDTGELPVWACRKSKASKCQKHSKGGKEVLSVFFKTCNFMLFFFFLTLMMD